MKNFINCFKQVKAALFFVALFLISLTNYAQHSIVWTSLTNVTATANTIKKTGGAYGYDAGAVSSNKLLACEDGWAECKINYQSAKIFGLSPNCSWSQLNSPNDIRFGFIVGATEYWTIEDGYQYPGFPSAGFTYSSGDVFRVERIGNIIRYYRNGTVVRSYTLASSPSTDWCFVATIADPYAGASDISNATASFAVSTACGTPLWSRDATNGITHNIFGTDKLGIGTTTPTEKLDVDGTLRVRSITNNNALTRFLVVDNNGVVNYKDNVSSFGGWYKQGTTTPPTSITDDIFTSGKVGIGTNTPAKILDIKGHEPDLRISDNNVLASAKSAAITMANAAGYWTLSGPRSYEVKNNFSIWWNAGSWKRYFTATDDGRFLMGDNTAPSAIGTYRLYVDGNAYINGTWTSSDKRLKREIQRIESPIEKLSKLNGYTYYFNEMPDSILSLPSEKQYGLLAQELLEVMPEAVKQNESGYYAVNYDMVIPVLVSGIKQQQEIITTQNQRIDQLEKEMEEIKAMIKNQGGSQPSQQNPASTGSMNVVPNPTYGKTTVNYTISGDYANASVIVYNELGQKMGEYVITQKGNGSVDVDATSFAGGAYFCKLVVDENIREVKKFIVSK